MQDKHGDPVSVELPGYHIPKAKVRLLSPQILLKTIGGQSQQTTKGIAVSLDNGIEMNAFLCPRSNLPVIPLAVVNTLTKSCLWTQAFSFSVDTFHDLPLI